MGQDITLTSKDGFQLGAYKAEPQGKPRGAIVVIQEIFGVNHHIRSVTDRYAQLGYLAIAPALFDPEVGIDFAHMLHAGQEFEWGALVVAGDEVTTTTTVAEIAERGGMGSYVFQTDSRNQRDEIVCTGIWRQLVRGSES